MTAPTWLARMMLDGAAPRGRTFNLGLEDIICVEIATRLRAATINGRLNAVWLHVANEVGGRRDARAGMIAYAKAKLLGFRTGAADYLIMWQGGCGAIEVKAPRGTKSQSQTEFERWCSYAGVPYAIARSADEFENHLVTWGALLPARKPSVSVRV